jgi:hypothetical protein
MNQIIGGGGVENVENNTNSVGDDVHRNINTINRYISRKETKKAQVKKADDKLKEYLSVFYRDEVNFEKLYLGNESPYYKRFKINLNKDTSENTIIKSSIRCLFLSIIDTRKIQIIIDFLKKYEEKNNGESLIPCYDNISELKIKERFKQYIEEEVKKRVVAPNSDIIMFRNASKKSITASAYLENILNKIIKYIEITKDYDINKNIIEYKYKNNLRKEKITKFLASVNKLREAINDISYKLLKIPINIYKESFSEDLKKYIMIDELYPIICYASDISYSTRESEFDKIHKKIAKSINIQKIISEDIYIKISNSIEHKIVCADMNAAFRSCQVSYYREELACGFYDMFANSDMLFGTVLVKDINLSGSNEGAKVKPYKDMACRFIIRRMKHANIPNMTFYVFDRIYADGTISNYKCIIYKNIIEKFRKLLKKNECLVLSPIF